MSVHEKIRIVRKAKGLTLEEVAHQLGMSTNGYGDIERGATDVSLSRLEQISQLFDMELSELIDLNEKNVFNKLRVNPLDPLVKLLTNNVFDTGLWTSVLILLLRLLCVCLFLPRLMAQRDNIFVHRGHCLHLH